MKVACIQTDIKVGDFDYNISKAKQFISEAATKGAKLICLPELFATGVTLKTNNLEENNPGRTCEFLSKQAKEKKVYLLSSFIEKNNSNLPKNTMVVFNPEGLLVAKYSKNHVFTFGKENESYSNGEGVVSFSLDDFNVSTMICYDLRFPELFRIATDNKVNAFIVIANWPNPRKEHWRTLLKARAIENQAFVIGINRVGHSEEFSFFGSSMIISPKGEILMEADDKEGVFLEDIDIKSEHFIELLNLIEKNELTELNAQEILRTWIPKSSSPKSYAKKYTVISGNKEIEKIADKVIKENKKAVEDYKNGKTWAINFLVGQIMKLTNKRADFNVAKKILVKKLD